MSCTTGSCNTAAGACHADVKLRLHYFNARGRAELVRTILAYVKRDFEDVRYTKEEWTAKKEANKDARQKSEWAEFPTGQLPTLEMITKDGKHHHLTQSLTIARSLANKHGLAGKDEIERARCDEVIDCLDDLVKVALLAYLEQDAERKEKIKTRLRDEEYPRLLGYLEKRLKKNGGKHIVGQNWTWADFAIANFVDGLIKRGADEAKILERIPTLAALTKSVDAIPEIAAWQAKRPATEM